jgi:hypothetical protein
MMSKKIRARLREAAVKYTTLCPVPHTDVEEALDLIEELRARLKDVTDQLGDTVKHDGRDLGTEAAYRGAVALLERLDAEDADEGEAE